MQVVSESSESVSSQTMRRSRDCSRVAQGQWARQKGTADPTWTGRGTRAGTLMSGMQPRNKKGAAAVCLQWHVCKVNVLMPNTST